MSRPLALDLFCKAGGASVGMYRAGFDVIGCDIEPQPHYPFDFVQADALNPPFNLREFDFIWASPMCQDSSILRNLPWLKGKSWPQQIPATRKMLRASGVTWCIENVPGAPLHGITLCGTMFGLPCYRHRVFETDFFLMAPGGCLHREKIGPGRLVNDRGTLNASSARGSWGKGGFVTVAGHQFKKRDGERALGIDWMTRDELAQAIPPAYAQFIAEAALAHLRAERLAA